MTPGELKAKIEKRISRSVTETDDGTKWRGPILVYANEFEALLTALEAQAWRGIESAPKDGTLVDLWNRDGFRMVNMCWKPGGDVDPRCAPGGIWEHLAMEGWRSAEDADGCGCLTAEQFTHWRPLPTPPVSEEQRS